MFRTKYLYQFIYSLQQTTHIGASNLFIKLVKGVRVVPIKLNKKIIYKK